MWFKRHFFYTERKIWLAAMVVGATLLSYGSWLISQFLFFMSEFSHKLIYVT